MRTLGTVKTLASEGVGWYSVTLVFSGKTKVNVFMGKSSDEPSRSVEAR